MTPQLILRTLIRSKFMMSCGAVLLFCFHPVFAQQDELTPPKAEVKAIVGGASFGEDQIPHGVIGGSVRVYLSRHLSIEPEFLYMRHSREDQDYVFTPNLAYELTNPTGRFVPYVIGGLGVIHSRSRFRGFDFTTGAPRDFDTSFTTWTATGGAGVRIFLTDRLFIAPEGRIGREPRFRGTLSVGYVFSGRK